MYSFIIPLLKRDIKNYYPSKWSFPVGLSIEFTTLLFIFYTSKAFIPDADIFKNDNIDYFSYIVIGDLCFRLPSLLIMSFTRILKNHGIEGSLDHLFLTPGSFHVKLLKESHGIIILEAIKIVFVLIMATLCFNLHISIKSLICLLIFFV